MSLAEAWFLDTYMATGGSPDTEHPCGLVATWTVNIHKEPGCDKTMNPDMALGSSLGLEVTMASGGKQACGPPLSPNLSHIYPPSILRANCLGGYVCVHLCALYVLFLKPNS